MRRFFRRGPIPGSLGLLGACLVLAIGGSGVAGRQAPAAEGRATQVPPSVARLLAEFDRARTVEEAQQAFKRATVSKAEFRYLDAEFGKSGRGEKLLAFRRQAQARAASRPRPAAVPPPDLVLQRRTADQQRAQRVARANREAARFKTESTALPDRPAAAAGGTAPLGPADTRMRAERPTPAPEYHVFIGLEPDEPMVGRAVELSAAAFGGDGFGDSPGRVVVIVGEGREAADRFQCDVSSWSRGRIRMVVNPAIEALYDRFHEGVSRGVIWVQKAGTSGGPWTEARLRLDPERFKPRISSLSSRQLEPGQRVVVRGNNFDTGHEPNVFLSSSAGSARLTVVGYERHLLELTVPDDISGVSAEAAVLEVTNGVGQTVEHPVSFRPAETFGVLTRAAAAHCFPDNFPSSSDALCIFGEENHYRPFEGTRLLNGWRADSTSVHTEESGVNAGCYFATAPAAGSTDLSPVDVVAWADAWSHVYCRFTVTLRGPRGVGWSAGTSDTR